MSREKLLPAKMECLCMCVRLHLCMCVRLSMYMLDEEMTKIKVVDLNEFYNFYFHDFFSINHLVSQNYV